jgi:hypothetical protein
MRKPPTEYVAPWLRLWRNVKHRLRRSGLLCWLSRHDMLTDRDTESDGESSWRYRRRICLRCGHIETEIYEVQRSPGGEWARVPKPNDLGKWMYG